MNKQIITSAALLGAFGLGFLGCLFHADGEWSMSERRPLAQKPAVSVETLSSGKYMKDFERISWISSPCGRRFGRSRPRCNIIF